jgi:hypothetical protein
VVSANGEGALPWLEERLALDSPHDQLAAGLLATLVEVPGPAAIEIALRSARDGELHEGARQAAVAVLASIARHRTDVARELAALLDAARGYRLQSALIEGLGELGGAHAALALQRFYARTREPRQKRAIEAALAGLAP